MGTSVLRTWVCAGTCRLCCLYPPMSSRGQMHTCVHVREPGQGRGSSPGDWLRLSLLQVVSFLVNNNLFTQSWAHVELTLSAHVYDKTVDLSELSPTNRWGNWSTGASHRAAALMPGS